MAGSEGKGLSAGTAYQKRVVLPTPTSPTSYLFLNQGKFPWEHGGLSGNIAETQEMRNGL